MAKMRVSELAKELDIPSKDIISYLNGFGLEIKSHSSNLDEKQISMIRGIVSINGGKLDVGTKTDSAKKDDAEKKPAKKTEAKAKPAEEKKPEEKALAPAEKKAEEPKKEEAPAPVEKKEEPARINILGNVYVQQAERQAAKAAERAAQAQNQRPQGERRYGERPQGGRPQGDRPQGERRYGDRPQGGRPQGGRPQGDRPQGERRYGERPQGGRPQGDRPQGERRYGDRPQGGRPQGDRPQGERRFGDRPQGQRPQGGMGGRPQGGGFNKDRFFDKDADKDTVQKRPAARGRNDGRNGAASSIKADFANELTKEQRVAAFSHRDRDKEREKKKDREMDDVSMEKMLKKKDPNRKGAFIKPEVVKPVEEEIKSIVVPEVITVKELADK